MMKTPYGAGTTADQILNELNLHGRRMIVTGGASGIGLETTRSLAKAGARVVVATRRPEAAEGAISALRRENPNAEISVRALDLADLRSVRTFIEGWEGPLHALINNAGVMALPSLERSRQGYEMQFATNFLGHFALTLGLRRYLAEANGARVISVSSTGNLFAPVFWDDPHFRFIPYDPLLAYAQSKTACILLAISIASRWAGDGIVANALNPGAIATNLQRYTGGLQTPKALQKSPSQGAATSVLLAASPCVEGVTGRYFDDCQIAPMREARRPGIPDGVASYALNSDNAERLWQMALQLMGR
ncbi:SDR family NAD(P)-dependent oxidoreductase [Salinicola halimionae]|uniref:SDR family NAD(P)-dependent oxidoreductase n=1 Tax=Salinicola halimionae TaxID=1949081 RepID=UPI001CB6C7A7|nr:SDR family NAD(P)-dependent oxidoreductase [Salinicola halimionae]